MNLERHVLLVVAGRFWKLELRLILLQGLTSVSYTHLTLPTNREV